MSEILRKWFNDKLGVILDFNLLSFGDIAKDGNLLAQLLYNYGIINTDTFNNIEKTDNADIAFRNLQYLNKNLNMLGINFTDKKLRDIADGDGHSAIKLFYQLYLTLNSKNKLHVITNDNLIDKQTVSYEYPYFKVRKSVIQTTPLYEWHKNKYLHMLDRCKYMRENYIRCYEQKLKQNSNILLEPTVRSQKDVLDFKNLPVEPSKDKVVPGKCIPDLKQAKLDLENLKQKERKAAKNQLMQKYMHKMLLNNLLQTLAQKQNDEHKFFISSKLLRQSHYEKQMANKMIEIRNQQLTVVENRKLENATWEKKRDYDFVEQLTQHQHNVSLIQFRNDLERKRILELHRRLFDEKRKRKYKKHYAMCQNICYDIIDLAVKCVEYKRNYQRDIHPALWKEWAALFCSEQPIFEDFEPVEDLLNYEESDEECAVLTNENYKQDALDEKYLNDYICMEWPWNLDEVEKAFMRYSDLIKLGLNILGYIIHKLLLVKYPIPPVPSAPHLPIVTTSACITGIKDDSIVCILERLFKNKKIVVIHMQYAINFCLDAYLKETVKEIDTKLNDETKKVVKKKGKKRGKEKKSTKNDEEKKSKGKKDKKKKGKKSKASERTKKASIQTAYVPKETQTPNIFPGEEVELTPQAELGKFAYETLHLGLEINNKLLTDMFVEYLKSLKDIKGWILVNYPEKIEEAITLELTLTGKQILFDTEGEEEEAEEFQNDENEYVRQELYKLPPDENMLKRISKLVPKPETLVTEIRNTSYLSSFVNVTKYSFMCEEEAIEYEFVDNFINPVEKFYTKLGCNNSMLYDNTFGPKEIQELVFKITQDNIFARDVYSEILRIVNEITEEKERQRQLAEQDTELKKKDKKKKKGKDKKGKGEKKKEKGKKKKDKSEKKTDKSEKKSDKSEKKKGKRDKKKGKQEEENEQKTKAVVSRPSVVEEVVLPPALPGELRWEYVNLNQSNEFQNILATTWEDIEDIYMNDFKQLFFLQRVNQHSVIPYVHETDIQLTNLIKQPDNKQEYLHRFQETFNELDNDLREDDEFKAELHCRVMEFKTKLWDICAQKLKQVEEERVKIINDNWFTNQAIALNNIYVAMMELELDRNLNTYQLLQDYYTSMITPESFGNKFHKNKLDLFQPNNKVFYFVANAYRDTDTTTENDPFSAFFQVLLDTALNITKSLHASAVGILKKIGIPKSVGKDKKKKKEKMLTEKTDFTPLVQEWQCAIEGELYRVKLRLNLIAARAMKDIGELLLYGENLFHEVSARLNKRYLAEVQSVNDACEIFEKAIEASEGIQPRLVLKDSKLLIDKYVLMYDDPFKLPEERKESTTDLFFTILQLSQLTEILFDLAPNGSLPTKTFTFLLQDMVACSTKDDNKNILPKYWNNLQPHDVLKVVRAIFGTVEYIYWKDFIIYNLELPFPTENELLEMRMQFRKLDPDYLEMVNSVQFGMVHFWFENRIENNLRRNLIKKLLCRLFQTSHGCINYAILLLSFCKDENMAIGVAKALELCLGNFVCWNQETGKNYVEICRYQTYLNEQEKFEALSAATSVYSHLLHKIVPSENTLEEQTLLSEHLSICNESLAEEEYVITSEYPSICYFLTFDAILVIMTASLPWHCRVQCLEDNSLKERLEMIYESIRNEEFDNKVLAHEFLNNEAFLDYLEYNFKFLVRSPADIVKSIVEICTCDHDSED